MYCCMPTQHTKALPHKNALFVCIHGTCKTSCSLRNLFESDSYILYVCNRGCVSIYLSTEMISQFFFLHIPDFSVFWEPFVCFSTYYWWMWAQASLIMLYLCNCREYVCSVCHDTSSFFIPAQVWPMRNSSVSSHLLLMWMKWNHENHTGWER